MTPDETKELILSHGFTELEPTEYLGNGGVEAIGYNFTKTTPSIVEIRTPHIGPKPKEIKIMAVYNEGYAITVDGKEVFRGEVTEEVLSQYGNG